MEATESASTEPPPEAATTTIPTTTTETSEATIATVESAETASPKATAPAAIEATKTTAPTPRTPGRSSGTLVARKSRSRVVIEGLRPGAVLHTVPTAVVVFLPAAARILIYIAIVVGVVVITYPRRASGIASWASHLAVPGRVLRTAIRVTVGH